MSVFVNFVARFGDARLYSQYSAGKGSQICINLEQIRFTWLGPGHQKLQSKNFHHNNKTIHMYINYYIVYITYLHKINQRSTVLNF